MNKSPRIVYMGTPSFAVSPLKELLERGYDVVGIITAPDKASGRGQVLSCSDVKKFAQNLNIPILQPVSLKDESFIKQLTALKGDLFIVVAFRMLPKAVWAMPALGTFNLHASLLPDYRGAAPINRAIINGETRTGVTTFVLDEEIDTGDILFQQCCEIEPEDDFGSLHDKLMKIGTDMVIRTVNVLANEEIRPQLQSSLEAQMGKTNPAPKLTKETGRIDWSIPLSSIHNLVRGLCPYPCAYSEIISDGIIFHVKIFKTQPERVEHNLPPGSIVSDGKKYLKVACSGGFLEIIELQIAGKKRLSAREFLAGFRNIEKYRFQS